MARISEEESRRRKRERIIILILLVVVGILTYVETRVVRFGAGLPISNTVIMFILININTLVLLLLIFLVFRNIVKLLYDRKRKVMGAKLRTKLVVAFAGLSLIPTISFFLFDTVHNLQRGILVQCACRTLSAKVLGCWQVCVQAFYRKQPFLSGTDRLSNCAQEFAERRK